MNENFYIYYVLFSHLNVKNYIKICINSEYLITMFDINYSEIVFIFLLSVDIIMWKTVFKVFRSVMQDLFMDLNPCRALKPLSTALKALVFKHLTNICSVCFCWLFTWITPANLRDILYHLSATHCHVKLAPKNSIFLLIQITCFDMRLTKHGRPLVGFLDGV